MRPILFVDDSPLDTELALDALRDAGLANEIVAVCDGAEALDYLHRRGAFSNRPEGDPAVVLLDLKMPKVDGREVLRQVKADPRLRLIPVVVMTSSRTDSDLMETYKLGVSAYVVKPVKFLDFVDAVKRFGYFWGLINTPPPTTSASSMSPA